MVSRYDSCDMNRLRRFLEVPPAELDGSCDLANHLERCERCRAELEALAGGRWWNEVRGLVRPETGDCSGTCDSSDNPASKDELTLGFLAPPDQPGHLGRFGPYQVLSLLGRGGMGVVLKARDAALGRIVAIKVLAPQLATSGSARQRFTREARAAAAVVHPHVVAIYAIDTDKASGLPYLVMPCVAGCSLQDRINRDGPMEPFAILRVGMQAAAGLSAAHAQGIIHRDVKPANILLENGIERVVLTDFGLARAVDDASLTQSGVISGTPQYMAPEQARGDSADHRADLFSLGSVLYAMCTGRAPFRAASTLAVLRRVADDAPRPVREVNPTVPEALAAVVEKLHAKDPANRYQSATEVAQVLEQLLATLQMPGQRATSAPVQKQMMPLRHRRLLAALACGFIVAALGLVVATVKDRQTPLWKQSLTALFFNSKSNTSASATYREATASEGDANDYPPPMPPVPPLPPMPPALPNAWVSPEGKATKTVIQRTTCDADWSRTELIEVFANGFRKVEIVENAQGIAMTLIDVKNGKETKQECRAKDAAELATKHPEAYKIYKDYKQQESNNKKKEAKRMADEAKRMMEESKRMITESKRMAEESKRMMAESSRQMVEEAIRMTEEAKRIAKEAKRVVQDF